MNFKNPEGQIARWLETLSSYNMTIKHRPGKLHRNADAVSRIPCRQCGIKGHPEAERNIATLSHLHTVDNYVSENCPSLAEAQCSDSDIQKVKRWVLEKKRPDSKDIGNESYFIKSLWGQWKRLQIHNDLLVRTWLVLDTDITYFQAIVPMKFRRHVLRFSHDIKASGHLGVKKTLSKIRQGYYWPGLQNDVRNYVAGCELCMKRKGPLQTKRAPMQIVRSGYPMERIAMDILGELPQTERGNKYILVVADYFTKWTESFAMPNIEAKTVAKILVEEVISRFGIPKIIHSDQGSQFESKLFMEMCDLLQIQKTRTTPYHPHSDGMVEKFNKTLTTMLSMYVKDHHRDWDENLPYVMMAYMSVEHETTGMTPNLLMLGRETSTPLDIAFEMPVAIKNIPQSQWVWQLQEKLEQAHSLVREHTGESIRRQKRYHDSKLSFENFKEGDKVYVYFPVKKVGCSSKFTSFWRGPFEIVEKISDVLYKVNCGRFESFQIIHVNRMRKAKSQSLMEEEDSCSLSFNDDISISDSQADIETNDVTEEVVTNRYGREIRKPKFLHDYVCSIFRMAKTKKTERKQVVKDNQSALCRVCGKIFKKSAYMKQHLKRIHAPTKCSQIENTHDLNSNNIEDNQREKQTKTEGAFNTGDSDESDWDIEPDITIDEPVDNEENILRGTEMLTDNCSVPEIYNNPVENTMGKTTLESMCTDKRSVNDIRSGRIIRKATKPTIICPPKKSEKVTIKQNNNPIFENHDVDTSINEEISELEKEYVVSRENEGLNKIEADENKSFQINIEFDGQISNRCTEIVDEGNILVSSTSVVKDGLSVGNMNIKLSEFMHPNTLIKAENIEYQIEGKELKLYVRY
jgi:transposase InsO family protein